jgi:two-component system cell cycle sensor histidine kinase/response regulator CckA
MLSAPNVSVRRQKRIGPVPFMLILVVDDDELVRGVVTELLQDMKFSVIEAKSGAEAVDLIRNRSDLDLVISDVNMPEMDGYRLVEEVTSMRPSLPVILMSGRPSQGRQGLFLPKPFTRDGLLACIARVVGSGTAMPRAGRVTAWPGD